MELAEILWYKSLTKSGVGFLDESADKGNHIYYNIAHQTPIFEKMSYPN